jgi:protein O-mannosyl-transferase
MIMLKNISFNFFTLYQSSVNNKKLIWSIVLIIMLTLLVYSQILSHDFVNFDDDGYVYNNQYVRSGISGRGINYAFTTMDKGNWIPLTWLSHMLDVQFFGLNPGGHHFINLLFHIFNSSLLFVFLKTNTQKLYSSLIVAILFAIHPLHVESVAWISERKDVLSTFLFILTLIMYSKYAKQLTLKNYILTLSFFLTGLIAKPMLVTLPIILVFIDIWPVQRISLSQNFDQFRNNKIIITEKIPFVLISIIFSFIAIWSQKIGGTVASSTRYPPLTRLMNALLSYAMYIYKMIWPLKLAVFYPYERNIDFSYVILSALLLLSISSLVVFISKKHPYVFVGWFWFLTTLLPVIGIVKIGTQSMADRYTYIPLIGLFIGIVWGMRYLVIKLNVKKYIILIFVCFVISFYLTITWQQIKTWKNSYTLFEHALSVTTNNWVAHLNFGEILFDQGRIDDAIAHYNQALEYNSSFELAYLNLGTAFAKKGLIDDSINYYKKAIKINNNLQAAWINLGNAYFRKGRLDKALVYYHQAIRVKSDNPEAYNGIGAVMVKKGEKKKAILSFKKALEIDPHFYIAKTNLKEIEGK